MDQRILEQRIAYLEFINDQLVSEIHYVDQLLRLIGFPEGLTTIKNAAKEVIQEEGLSSGEESQKDPDKPLGE